MTKRKASRSESPKLVKKDDEHHHWLLFGDESAAKRPMIWMQIVIGLVVSIGVVSFIADAPVLLVALIVITGAVTFPLQMLLSGIAYEAWLHEPFMVELVVFTIALSASLGLSLIICSKVLPVPIMRVLTLITWIIGTVIHLFGRLIPYWIQIAFGAIYTAVTEFLLMPAIFCLLSGVASLRLTGEDFNKRPFEWTPSTKKKDTVLIFLHGNEFNECQWLLGRLILFTRPWSEKVEFLSVNIFAGAVLRDHTARSKTIIGSANLAMDQIEMLLKKHNLEPKQVILMGHSLGGIIAAYITEYLAKERGLPVERVVAWSAPFGGSDLLAFGKRHGLYNERTQTGMNNEFCPTNKVTRELWSRMEKTEATKPMYFVISGGVDPLVRPPSALPHFVREEHKKLIPYFGHYNIKVSVNAWIQVTKYVDDFFKDLR